MIDTHIVVFRKFCWIASADVCLAAADFAT